MFSITVIFDNAFVSWNVRTMPWLAILCAGTRSIDFPLKVRWPESGVSKLVNRLKKVVLPAPFGPISAVMTPRWISTCSTSTAVSPPKRRTTSSATRIGSGFAAPGSHGTSASAARAASGSTPSTDKTSAASDAGSGVLGSGAFAPFGPADGISSSCSWTSGSDVQVLPRSSVIERHLFLVAEDPLGSECSEQSESQTDQHETDLPDLGAFED